MERKAIKSVLTRIPIGGAVTLRAYRSWRRYRFARSYYARELRLIRRWAVSLTEDTNFYYELTPRNEAALTTLVAAVTGTEVGRIEGYVEEVKADAALYSHIASAFKHNTQMRDVVIGYGRRIGWYAFVRALKPRLVVETGVAHGVGASVLCAALLRNLEEGYEGSYLGTEINPDAGELLTGIYASVGRVAYGDSLDSLRMLTTPIDVFINDSDHSELYESMEYEAVAHLLSASSIILGDNSHVTNALRDFSVERGRPYFFFSEVPRDHWYPGAGIGISPTQIPLIPRPRHGV
jgi:hypothetical protein